MTELTAKERLFETAARLFYQRGYRAVGVDAIAAESGVGKMTLYRHFPSKDDLIAAFLEQSDGTFWRHFEQSTAESSSASEALVSFFRALEEYVRSPDCYGCPFLNVATEYPAVDQAGHRIALAHKQAVLGRFGALAEEAGAQQPAQLAHALFLLMDGAYMAARMFGDAPDHPASGLAATARCLIEAHCHTSSADQHVC